MPDPVVAIPVQIDTAQAAAQSARSAADNWSPPEGAADQAGPWNGAPPQPMPGANPNAYAEQLAQSRAADKSSRQKNVESAQPSSTAQSDTPATAPNGLEWKRTRSDDWNKIKTERDTLKAEVEAFKKNGANGHTQNTTSTDPFAHPEVVKLKAERDQYYETVKLAKAEQDPEFKARFDGERDSIMGFIKQRAGGARDDVVEIMSMPPGKARDRALSETIKDFGESGKAEILAANARLIALDVNRKIELETRARTWDQRNAAQAQQGDARRQQEESKFKSAFDRTVKKWQDPDSGMPFVLPARDAKDNQAAQKIFAKAEAILFGQSQNYGADDVATDALKAASWDEVVLQANYVLDELERVRSAYERVVGTAPGADAPARAHVDAPAGQVAQAVMAQARNVGAPQGIPVLENMGQYNSELAMARQADKVRKYQGR